MALVDVARKTEEIINKVTRKRAEDKGWVPKIVGYAGYGSTTRLHVLGRVLMADTTREEDENWAKRGYRQFFTIQVGGLAVCVTAGDKTIEGVTNDNGYIDVIVFDHGLEPGWHDVTIEADGAETITSKVQIIPSSARIGLISDVDDTTMVTYLPRPLIAAWNSWVKRTDSRKAVDGMANFYSRILADYPDAPVFYLSTGAWNTYDTLQAFMRDKGFPTAPMLLTDWGPTQTKMFRSGTEHKKIQLRNLIIEFPDIKWILVGDDGQHDPLTYGDLVMDHPAHVAGIAIRNLTPQEHVLSHGTAAPLVKADSGKRAEVRLIQGEDGFKLLDAYQAHPFTPEESAEREE